LPEVGVQLPILVPDAGPRTAIDFAQRAEAAGADSVWAGDRVVFRNQEPLLNLAAAAAVTSRVKLGTCVLLATLRPPALLAKMVATLDQMSGGRAVLGMGVGSRADDFAAEQVDFEHRGTRAEELVDILRLAWAEQPLKYEGRFYDLDVGPVGPKPVQLRIPIWFGGSVESALRRIGRIGDGYIGGSGGGPDGFRASWEKIRRYAEAEGRDPQSITPAALIYACVDEDRARAEELAAAHLRTYYGPRRTDTSSFMLGSVDDCMRIGTAYAAAGVRTFIIGSVTADQSYFDRLCDQLLPRLQQIEEVVAR
jgi:probable F420-dependent oxidoreductase